MLLTIFSLGIAILRTILRFETIRDKILDKARVDQLKARERK
jgi:hypothetical protein